LQTKFRKSPNGRAEFSSQKNDAKTVLPSRIRVARGPDHATKGDDREQQPRLSDDIDDEFGVDDLLNGACDQGVT
jgi:hypothetical protein